MERITRADVQSAASSLLRKLQDADLIPKDAALAITSGSVTCGQSWDIRYRSAATGRTGEMLHCVDLRGAFSARDAYERLTAANCAISDYAHLQLQMVVQNLHNVRDQL